MASDLAAVPGSYAAVQAAQACPWKDTDHLANPDAYCTWCDGFTAALAHLRSLPVEQRMEAMGMTRVSDGRDPHGRIHYVTRRADDA